MVFVTSVCYDWFCHSRLAVGRVGSVCSNCRAHGANEDAALAKLQDETVEEITGETYGGLKALCESAVQDALPGRTTMQSPSPGCRCWRAGRRTP